MTQYVKEFEDDGGGIRVDASEVELVDEVVEVTEEDRLVVSTRSSDDGNDDAVVVTAVYV